MYFVTSAVEMLRNSKIPVVRSPVANATPSTSRDHDAASDRRGAIDRAVHVEPNSMVEENGGTESELRETINHEAAIGNEVISDNEETMEHESGEVSHHSKSVESIDIGALQEKLNDAQLKFERACQQIVVLDQKIKDLEVRYKRAVKVKQNSFRYNLRLKLSVFTGIKMMYHHYAGTKADELTRLHRQRHTSTRQTSASTDSRQSS